MRTGRRRDDDRNKKAHCLITAGVSLWGRVDSNHRTHPRTDLQSVAIAAMRLPLGFALQKYIIFQYVQQKNAINIKIL